MVSLLFLIGHYLLIDGIIQEFLWIWYLPYKMHLGTTYFSEVKDTCILFWV